jgi:hypothetical protein
VELEHYKVMALQNGTHSNGYLEAVKSEQARSTRSSSHEEMMNIHQETMHDGQEEYTVENLLREKPGPLGSLIEVKWKGWTTDHNTWQLRSQLLEDVPDMLAEFDDRQHLNTLNSSEGAPMTGMVSDRASTMGDAPVDGSESTTEQQSDPVIANWKGWAELENDPLIFSTLLREWGVRGVGVREVIPLDAVFDTPVDSTLGLIFLSRYVVFDQGTGAETSSDDLWFANQISSFSCATVALMNIINNRTDLELGEELQRFKASTQNLLPKARGLALDSFESVRDVHNSFATENDKLYVDVRLKDDAKAANTKKRAQDRWKGRKGRKKAKMVDDDETGLHFVAFVPAMGQLWRLDGLEREPTSVGRIAEGGNWLMMVVPILEAQFNAAAMNELEFSLLSVVLTTPDAADEKDHERMRRVREDWGPMMATLLRLHAEKGDLAKKLG